MERRASEQQLQSFVAWGDRYELCRPPLIVSIRRDTSRKLPIQTLRPIFPSEWMRRLPKKVSR